MFAEAYLTPDTARCAGRWPGPAPQRNRPGTGTGRAPRPPLPQPAASPAPLRNPEPGDGPPRKPPTESLPGNDEPWNWPISDRSQPWTGWPAPPQWPAVMKPPCTEKPMEQRTLP